MSPLFLFRPKRAALRLGTWPGASPASTIVLRLQPPHVPKHPRYYYWAAVRKNLMSNPSNNLLRAIEILYYNMIVSWK